jgi:small nuclear ribonucleoprotein (snRNP)-like protein
MGPRIWPAARTGNGRGGHGPGRGSTSRPLPPAPRDRADWAWARLLAAASVVLVLAAAMPCDAAWAPPAAAPLLALRGGAPSSDGDEQRRAQLTTEEMMQKMIGALVTVSLKVGPQLRGRLKDIDVQMNIMLQRPVEQWVNGTLAAVDDGDVFVRCHNVIDFGVLRGTEDPATVQILEDLGIRPGRGWDDEPAHAPSAR